MLVFEQGRDLSFSSSPDSNFNCDRAVLFLLASLRRVGRVDQILAGDTRGSWMAEQGTPVHTPVGGLLYGVPGAYGVVDHSNQIQGRMGGVPHAMQQQQIQQQTPFLQRDHLQQYSSQATGQYSSQSFGKVNLGGQGLADSKDSWRSKSESWRSGGGNQQGSGTWRTNSSSGWRGAGEQRGGQGGQRGHHHGQLGQAGYQGHSSQVSSMMSAMSLNGRSAGPFEGGAEQTMPVPATSGSGGGWYGLIPFGPSKSVHRYPTEVLARIYKQMLYSGRLGLPGGVQRDEPMLFTSAGEFVDVVEQLQGVPLRPKNAYIDLSSVYSSRENSGGSLGSRQKPPVASGTPTSLQQQELLPAPSGSSTHSPADMYTYIDPQGQWQGPFTRAEMLEWHAAGFFPLSLVVRGGDPPHMVSVLSDWLAVWNGSTPISMPNPPNHQTVQHVQNHLAAVPVQPQRMQQPVHQPVQPQVQDQQEELRAHGHVQVADPVVQSSPVADPVVQSSPVAPARNVEGENHPVQEEFPAELQTPVAETPQTAPEAPWLGSLSADVAISLKDIQQEEDARKAEIDETRAKAAAQQQKMRNSQSGWASVARSESLSLADIQDEEMKAHSQRSAIEAAAAAASLEKQQQRIANGGMWAAAASKPAVAPAGIPAHHTAMKMLSKPVFPPPPPPPSEKSKDISQTVSRAGPEATASLPMDSMAFGLEVPSSEEGALSGDFRDWCSQQMQSITGSSEVTLCEFLMGVESNSEIADYVRMYLGTSAAVATFSAEFIKRKLAVMAVREMTAAGRKKSRKARAKANRALASVSAGAEGNALTKNSADDSSWERVAKGGKGHGAATEKKATSNGLGKSRPAAATGFALLQGKGS